MEFNNLFNNDYGEDEENEIPKFPNMQGFLITPQGPIPINNSTLNKLINDNNNRPPLCTIFNGEYAIYVNGKVNDRIDRLLFECIKNPEYTKPVEHSLFDVYEYLNTTHFLNFLVSRNFGSHIWAYEGITLQIQMSESKEERYSKLLIMIEPSECDDWMVDYSLYDIEYETYSEQINKIPGTPIMTKVIKGKSQYTPIISYDISFGLNANSKIDFENIHLSNFYNIIMKEFITDAINTFYFDYTHLNEIRKLGEHLIRINFDIEYNERLLNVHFICTPAIFIDDVSKRVLKYAFTSSGHLISVNPVCDIISKVDQDLYTFANTICSTEHTQLVSLNCCARGVTSHYCEDYNVLETFDILCTQKRFLIHAKDRFMKIPNNDNQRIFSEFHDMPSKYDEIIDYWKSDKKINLSFNDYSITIYGFINFDTKHIVGKSYQELLPTISDELKGYFGYTISDFTNVNMKVLTCYKSFEFYRCMIYSVDIHKEKEITNSKDKGKKKFKLFGGG